MNHEFSNPEGIPGDSPESAKRHPGIWGTWRIVVSLTAILLTVTAAPAQDAESEKEAAPERSSPQEPAPDAKRAEVLEVLDRATRGKPVRGNPSAPITVVGFSDFQCGFCRRGAETVEQLLERYGDEVRFFYLHYPLKQMHPWAEPAAIAANCAARQDPAAFWTLHDRFFADQKAITADNVLAKSREFLADSGIDLAAWSSCAEDTTSAVYKEVAREVFKSLAAGRRIDVRGTPAYFVNGRFLSGAKPLADFEPLIEAARGEAARTPAPTSPEEP